MQPPGSAEADSRAGVNSLYGRASRRTSSELGLDTSIREPSGDRARRVDDALVRGRTRVIQVERRCTGVTIRADRCRPRRSPMASRRPPATSSSERRQIVDAARSTSWTRSRSAGPTGRSFRSGAGRPASGRSHRQRGVAREHRRQPTGPRRHVSSSARGDGRRGAFGSRTAPWCLPPRRRVAGCCRYRCREATSRTHRDPKVEGDFTGPRR